MVVQHQQTKRLESCVCDSEVFLFGQDLRADMHVHAWNAASWISFHQTVYLGRQLNN